MADFSQVLLSITLSIGSWIVWRIFRRRYFPTAFENLAGPPAESWIKGSLAQLTNANAWGFHEEISRKYGSVIRTKGTLGSDVLYVNDPKAMHHILVKDQNIYEEAEWFLVENHLAFGPGIFTTVGEAHRRQRKLLSPAFSIAHMREIVPIFYEVARKVQTVLSRKVGNGPQKIDLSIWATRLAMELIGQSGFGHSFDDLSENGVQHPCAIAPRQIATARTELPFLNFVLLPQLVKIGSPRFRRRIVDLLPHNFGGRYRDLVDLIHNTSVEIIEARKNDANAGVGGGKDIISILMKENQKVAEGDRMTEEELTGQIGSLTSAAFDTTSNAISRILHVLALHKEAQTKLREEIRNARQENGGGDLAYDVLVSLPYLDAVCRETLRLYSPVSIVDRITREDVILPLSKPVRGLNGQYMSEIPLSKGTKVYISIIASNRDPDLWGPYAYEWKPERWLKPLPESILNAHIPGIYSHLMTFMGGGRACLGFKFSQLEMKVVLVMLLERLEFSPSDEEIYWHMSGIVTPHTDFKDTSPSSLPLVVSLAN